MGKSVYNAWALIEHTVDFVFEAESLEEANRIAREKFDAQGLESDGFELQNVVGPFDLTRHTQLTDGFV